MNILGVVKEFTWGYPHLAYYFVIKKCFENIMHRCTVVENLGRGS
jgi:hypothetical protein